jgi:3-oxoacyl-[acyl-carrier-protein] synthase II
MAGRVVITGLGALTAAGTGRAGVLERAGSAHVRSRAFAEYVGFGPLDPVCAGSLADVPVGALLPPRGTRALSEEGRAASCAAVLACREAGLPVPGDRSRPLADEPHLGVALGTMRAGLDEYARLFTEGVALGPDRVMPARGPRTGYNTPASEVSILLGAAGPNLTVSSGAASAGDAIGAAADLVRQGRASAMLAGGVDLLSAMAVHAERVLDPGFGTIGDPRPFDRGREGAAPGEAAVVLLLETADRAARRGVTGLAEVAGTGTAFSAAAERPALAGAARRAIEEALARAGVGPGDVDAVVASADGSPDRDAAEAMALGPLFAGRPPVCSVNGSVGDCAGAGAAVQVAVAVAALEAQRLPATCGFRVPDPELAGLRVTREARRLPLRLVLTLTVDAGGHASAALLRREART